MSGTKRGYIGYKSYVFVDGKDPIIDRLRTAVQDSGKSYAQISVDSDVATSTLSNWFTGDVKRPQFATVMAVLQALDIKIEFKYHSKVIKLEGRLREHLEKRNKAA